MWGASWGSRLSLRLVLTCAVGAVLGETPRQPAHLGDPRSDPSCHWQPQTTVLPINLGILETEQPLAQLTLLATMDVIGAFTALLFASYSVEPFCTTLILCPMVASAANNLATLSPSSWKRALVNSLVFTSTNVDNSESLSGRGNAPLLPGRVAKSASRLVEPSPSPPNEQLALPRLVELAVERGHLWPLRLPLAILRVDFLLPATLKPDEPLRVVRRQPLLSPHSATNSGAEQLRDHMCLRELPKQPSTSQRVGVRWKGRLREMHALAVFGGAPVDQRFSF